MSRKYTFELKRNAVEHHLNTNDSFKVTARKFKIMDLIKITRIARSRIITE